jgi:hypothetical protein
MLSVLLGCHHVHPFGKRAHCGGCSACQVENIRKFSYFVSPILKLQPPRRLVLVCSQPLAGSYGEQQKFANALASEIRLAGVCEVIVPEGDLKCHCDIDTIMSGRFDEYEISSIAARYSADSVMFVRVNQLRAFQPMAASVTTVMVDANESVATMATDGVWQLNDPEIGRSYLSFVKSRTGNINPDVLDLQLQSPSYLVSYVAWQITSVMQQEFQ